MLRNGEPNPLNIYGNRQIEGTCPPHFTQVKFDLYMHQNIKEFSDWVWENLEGRFWAGDLYETERIRDERAGWKPTIQMNACIAFEIPSEATMFAMCRDQISKPNHL